MFSLRRYRRHKMTLNIMQDNPQTITTTAAAIRRVSFKVLEDEDEDVGDVGDAPTALSVVGCLPIATHWVAPHVVHPSGR